MKDKSLSHALFVIVIIASVLLWVLTSLLLTFSISDNLRHQGRAAITHDLNRAIEIMKELPIDRNPVDAESLWNKFPTVSVVPEINQPFLKAKEIIPWKAMMILDQDGVAIYNNGFCVADVPFGTTGLPEVSTGITVSDGSLSLIPTVASANERGGIIGFLTFVKFPLRSGSFPSSEFSSDYPENEKREVITPITAGRQTPISLLDGIDVGDFNFDCDSLIHNSVLRGAWVMDTAGVSSRFVLIACGWSPLASAVQLLSIDYILLLLLYLLADVIFLLIIRLTYEKPIIKLSETLKVDPMSVSAVAWSNIPAYSDIRNLVSGLLLRQNIIKAAGERCPEKQVEEAGMLVSCIQNVVRKQLPILTDRGQNLVEKYVADGPTVFGKNAVESILLTMLQEAIPFAERGNQLIICTKEYHSFLVVELEITAKQQVLCNEYEELWGSVYLSSSNEQCPGNKLISEASFLPGSYIAVSKADRRIKMSLGVPKAE